MGSLSLLQGCQLGRDKLDMAPHQKKKRHVHTQANNHDAWKTVTRDANKVLCEFRKDDFQMGIQQRLPGGDSII